MLDHLLIAQALSHFANAASVTSGPLEVYCAKSVLHWQVILIGPETIVVQCLVALSTKRADKCASFAF